jgi:hypothetical protein
MENLSMTNQLSGSTAIEPKKNIEEKQMEFSSSIQDVMSAPIDSMANVPDVLTTSPEPKMAPKSKYPLGLNKAQFESLIAGAAAVIIASGPVQEKIYDFMPAFLNESGKLSTQGMGVTLLLVAIVFYFMRQFLIKSR